MESVKSFKRKMLLWTSNWSQQDVPQTTEEVPFTPDAVEIATLLQTTGFRVRFMDRCLPKEMHPVPGVPIDSPACRVILMCPRSGIRMELDAPTSTCRCPTPDASDLGRSWTFSEVDSDRMKKAVNSIVSKPSTEISRTVSQLMGGLFHVISLFSGLNNNHIKEPKEIEVSSTTVVYQPVPWSSDCSSNSLVKTPATGIAVVTPNAPVVPKAPLEDAKMVISGRYRSLDTLIASDGFLDELPEPGPLSSKNDEDSGGSKIGMEVDNVTDASIFTSFGPDTTLKQAPGLVTKKFISKSSPAVNCRESFKRSSTFAFEDEEEEQDPLTKDVRMQRLLRSETSVFDDSGNTHAEEIPRVGLPPQTTPNPLLITSSTQSSVLLSKLQDIQLAVSDLIFMVAGNEKNLSNIGDVSKASKAVAGALQRIIMDNTVRPIRSLSDFGSVPNLTRTTTKVRSIPRLGIRRHTAVITAPATPTTSRRSGTNAVDRRQQGSDSELSKSVNASKTSSSRLTIFAGNSVQKIGTPLSTTTNTSASNDKETFLIKSPNRRVVNSIKRYTHVQSSIPKPGAVRK